ncbi:MAG: spore coat associated protein CotJA [Clostridia bacterium]|nr:spore coat associated protein CotJA [Clostridia bacterium]
MAYVRNESFGEIFDPERALEAGTVFPGLYKPFRGTGCTNNRYNGRGTYR